MGQCTLRNDGEKDKGRLNRREGGMEGGEADGTEGGKIGRAHV
jgi:hypothetical protein